MCILGKNDTYDEVSHVAENHVQLHVQCAHSAFVNISIYIGFDPRIHIIMCPDKKKNIRETFFVSVHVPATSE